MKQIMACCFQMWFMKLKMADCLAYWPHSGDDFCRPWNLCFDESAFTDEEGKGDTSLLDDLAEAKRRHISTDDVVENDTDTVSLWDDFFDEQWTTKDSNSGPTLAELNGGELTDLEHYEPLKIARKRKTSHKSSAASSQQNGGRSLAAPMINVVVDATGSKYETVGQTGASAGSCSSEKVGLLCDQQKSVSVEELQDEKGTNLGETCDQSSRLFLDEKQLKTASLLHQPKEESPDACRTCNGHLKQVSLSTMEHSLESNASQPVSKKMKTNHEGSIRVLSTTNVDAVIACYC